MAMTSKSATIGCRAINRKLQSRNPCRSLNRVTKPENVNCNRKWNEYGCQWRSNSTSTSTSVQKLAIVDLRSDTVTKPSKAMLDHGLNAPLGDDVFGEDPSVLALESYAADLFDKQAALYLPTGTMSNLTAVMAHCRSRAPEIIIGSRSHLCLWEGGGASNLAGVHTRQLPETSFTDGTLDLHLVQDTIRSKEDDDHHAKTELLCLENTHNLCGGSILPPSYLHSISDMLAPRNVKLHIDGARIFHASTALGTTVAEICRPADTVSVCLSKGLGAPLGSVLVANDRETIRLAKRARKRLGGGMRQAGLVAAMGLYALQHHVHRLEEDHKRAARVAMELVAHGFHQPQDGRVPTNIVYFAPPPGSVVKGKELCERLEREYGVKIGSGYCRGGELFRIVLHMDVDDEGVDRALEGLVRLCTRGD